MNIKQLLDQVEMVVKPLLTLPIRPPETISNDDYFICISALHQFSSNLEQVEANAGVPSVDGQSLLGSIFLVRNQLRKPVKVQYLTAKRAFTSGVQLPNDAFYVSKAATARWIASILSDWTMIQRRFEKALVLLPQGKREVVENMSANTALFDIPLDLTHGYDDDDFEWPDPPQDLPDDSYPKGALEELKEWYQNSNPKPGIEFHDGGATFTMTFDCDWDIGGS